AATPPAATTRPGRNPKSQIPNPKFDGGFGAWDLRFAICSAAAATTPPSPALPGVKIPNPKSQRSPVGIWGLGFEISQLTAPRRRRQRQPAARPPAPGRAAPAAA